MIIIFITAYYGVLAKSSNHLPPVCSSIGWEAKWADKGVDLTWLLRGGDIKEDWGLVDKSPQARSRGRAPVGGWGTKKLKLFFWNYTITHNICIKTQCKQQLLLLLDKITSKILEEHYHGRPPINFGGTCPRPIGIDAPAGRYGLALIQSHSIQTRSPADEPANCGKVCLSLDSH